MCFSEEKIETYPFFNYAFRTSADDPQNPAFALTGHLQFLYAH
ncbi:hypothetical protein RAHE111665_05715 [Rariglobus hedericola]